MPTLGHDSGYMVKYNPLPSGGLYLTVYPSSRPTTDTFRYSQLYRIKPILRSAYENGIEYYLEGYSPCHIGHQTKPN